jgi:hypothetical protein
MISPRLHQQIEVDQYTRRGTLLGRTPLGLGQQHYPPALLLWRRSLIQRLVFLMGLREGKQIPPLRRVLTE